MRFSKTLFISSVLLLFMTSAADAQKSANINFEVSFSEPQAHYADVAMEIKGIKKNYIDVKMPVWAPGSYLVREFSKNVESFTAADAKGLNLPVEKLNKNTWRIKSAQKDIKINYRVYCFEISVRTSFIDANHAFLSPTGIFLYPDGMLAEPSTVKIIPHKNWSEVSTGLAPVNGKKFTYYAKDFDWLFDSPIEVGNQDVFTFKAAGVNHSIAMYNGGNSYDKNKLTKDMAAIVETETAIFDENPNKDYVFIIHNFDRGGGGLEHLNSTVLGASRAAYASQKGYQSFLGLVAHEYFHLWNVKRLRPKALGPFNYDVENYTPNLWIAEGFTAYFDSYIVQKAGFSTVEEYLDGIAGDISDILTEPGARVQSLNDASLDAWIKYYRPNENSGNSTVSYYTKGSVIAILLNLEILNNSKGEKSLEDVMKYAYEEFYKKQGRGYTDQEFKAVLEKFTGGSLDDFYNKYIYGTTLPDVNKYLNYAGLTLKNSKNVKGELGINITLKEGKQMVTAVKRGSAAWQDGINVNDEVLGFNGRRIDDVTKALLTKKPGEKIELMISRDGMFKTISTTLKEDETGTYTIEQLKNASPQQEKILKSWLRF